MDLLDETNTQRPDTVAQLPTAGGTPANNSRSFFSKLKRAFRPHKRAHEPAQVSDNATNGVEEKAEAVEAQKDAQTDGSRLEIKRLDLVYDRTKSIWIKRESETQQPTVTVDEHAEFAFTVIRKFKVTSDPTLHVITTTYEIKSPQLRNIGEKVIGRVHGISWTSRTVSV